MSGALRRIDSPEPRQPDSPESLGPPPAQGLPRLLFSVDECASMLGVHRTTVFDLIAKGKLASVLIGRRRLVSLQAMEDFIRHTETGGSHGR